MCIVSAVVGSITSGPNEIPGLRDLFKYPPKPYDPNAWPIQHPGAVPVDKLPTLDKELASMLKDVLERLDRIDKKLGLKDCKVEQEKKDQLMKLLAEVVG